MEVYTPDGKAHPLRFDAASNVHVATGETSEPLMFKRMKSTRMLVEHVRYSPHEQRNR